ncbi:hypothetical protein Pcinc_044189 [Petrolisthes cinctipes]|uniref:Uncharacterized protein n=1 Tax=Petrolisthes cinctipes TaxID=88211 RepID=A0AAE1EH59_PETCI|nr:hypothetical protein Pcinc_044189 [Petrolisthes cinctipes]
MSGEGGCERGGEWEVTSGGGAVSGRGGSMSKWKGVVRGELVSYDRARVGMVVSGEKGAVTTSRLLVQTADTRHSGNYTCSPANSHPKSVIVHVIAGDQPQPIVHENSSSVLKAFPILSLSSILILLFLSSLATSTL